MKVISTLVITDTFCDNSAFLFINLEDVVQTLQVSFAIAQNSLFGSGPARLGVNVVRKPSPVLFRQPVDRHEVAKTIYLLSFQNCS